MRERSITPVVPFPPLSDDARALALCARGMAETFGGTFEDMILYVIHVLRDGPYRAAIGPACGIMGEERDGLIVIFDVSATVTPSEIMAAARALYGPDQESSLGQERGLTKHRDVIRPGQNEDEQNSPREAPTASACLHTTLA